MKAPAEFVRLCQAIGARVPLWTQGGGGNISCKNGDELWIKASGFRLDGVTETAGCARVRRGEFLTAMGGAPTEDAAAETYYAGTLKATAEPSLGRPSMETGFHALLPRKWVAHFHSLPGVLMAEEPAWITRQHPRAQVLPAIRPGWVLSRELARHGDAEILILTNHGVILQSDRPLEGGLLEEWRALERAYCAEKNLAALLALCEDKKPPVPAPAPVRIYFPDTAVFLDRIEKIRDASGALKADAFVQDRDAAELWVATQYLYEAKPSLRELPAEISSVLAGLPTEKFRRGEA